MASRDSRIVCGFVKVVLLLSIFSSAIGQSHGSRRGAAAAAAGGGGGGGYGVYNRTLAIQLVEHAAAVYSSDPVRLRAWNCSRCDGFTAGFNLTQLAYVGVQEGQGMIVVCFRGTRIRSLVNWVANLHFLELNLPYPGVDEAFVHCGFYEAYHNTTLRAGVIEAVQALQRERPHLQVVVTGHSLGAALACLCALDLTVNLGVQGVHVTTFGQPRVGNRAFATYFDQRVPNSVRMVHGHDLVPHLPPLSLARRLYSYYHTATEVWMFRMRFIIQLDVEKVCDSSGEDPSCSRSVLGNSIADHLVYFGVPLGEEGARSILLEEDSSLVLPAVY
eukprot:jgi/Mesen1/4563/ME000232S03828